MRKKRRTIRFEPISVRELLTNMKTYSDLMLDLSYSALLFSDEELIEWVMELEEQVDQFGYQLLMTLSLAVRDREDAEAAVGLFRVASSANRISDAAADIAELVHKGSPVDPLIRSAFDYVEEHLVRVKVIPGSAVEGKTIDYIWEELGANTDVIAIRRGSSWTVNPRAESQLLSGDIVFVRGSEKETSMFVELATGEKPAQPPTGETERPRHTLAQAILNLKETSEFMVSLAYAAVTYQDSDLAQEVEDLEYKFDEDCDRVLKEVMSLEDLDVNRKWTLTGVVFAAEEIADAAWEMAQVQLRGLPTHEVMRSVMQEADDIVARLQVRPGSRLVGKTLDELALDDEHGIYVQSVKRDGKWIHRPKGKMQLKTGDVLIVDGYRKGLDEVRAMACPRMEQECQ
ncbi:MAG: TrkA C-terminal domain-containing protein [Candidatus Thorarchaeota archaeon]